MQIKATPLDVPVTLDAAGIEKNTSLSVCLVEIRADDGMTGHGFTAITEEEVVAAAVNQVIAPALQDEDPLAADSLPRVSPFSSRSVPRSVVPTLRIPARGPKRYLNGSKGGPHARPPRHR